MEVAELLPLLMVFQAYGLVLIFSVVCRYDQVTWKPVTPTIPLCLAQQATGKTTRKKKYIAFTDSNGQKMLFCNVGGKLGQLMLSASLLQVFQWRVLCLHPWCGRLCRGATAWCPPDPTEWHCPLCSYCIRLRGSWWGPPFPQSPDHLLYFSPGGGQERWELAWYWWVKYGENQRKNGKTCKCCRGSRTPACTQNRTEFTNTKARHTVC